jgi:hypothetical protein
MSQTGSIQGAKIGSYNNMNDPTYPGPDGKVFAWKRNVALHLAQTRLPRSVYEYIDLGSEIFDLPRHPLTRLQRPRSSLRRRRKRTPELEATIGLIRRAEKR